MWIPAASSDVAFLSACAPEAALASAESSLVAANGVAFILGHAERLQPMLASQDPAFILRGQSTRLIQASQGNLDFGPIDVGHTGAAGWAELTQIPDGAFPGAHVAVESNLFLGENRERIKRRPVCLSTRHTMTQANAFRWSDNRKANVAAPTATQDFIIFIHSNWNEQHGGEFPGRRFSLANCLAFATVPGGARQVSRLHVFV